MAIVFTDHAIDRFIQRHAPDARRDEVLTYLEEHKGIAVRLKQKTFSGQFLWKIGDYRIVTKRDNHTDVAVTILPAETVNPRDYSPDELERIQEYQARVAVQEEVARAELAVANAAEEEAKALYLRAKATNSPKRAEACELMQHTQGLAAQTRKSVAMVLETMKIERANLKDWEKTIRHAMSRNAQDGYFVQMLNMLRTVDLPETRALVAEIEARQGMPADSPQSRTERDGSTTQESSPA